MVKTVLKPGHWKVVTGLAAAAIASVTILVAPVLPRPSVTMGLCLMTALTGGAYAFFASGRCLRFTAEGFEVKERLQAGRFTSWSDVEHIGVASFPNTVKGRLTYQNFAGVRLRDGVAQAGALPCRRNRAACGYDLLLAPNYGLSLDRFVTILQQQQREAPRR